MEIILSLGIGIFVGSGIWLILRPRTFQIILGLSLISYGVNLFMFSMSRPRSNAAPIVDSSKIISPENYVDPLPQALVLTAIVIGFATTALFLVILLVSRGLTGSDHVDGREVQ
ncbi:multicomponent K+:H+ antiporter subunit C [Bartonella japonica]|uniref:Multicomponent K+:H+ antiporter subunit C n=1 Tax=Bartonella japonica TaxID=357761 RepID=A0ABV2FLN1_9HYPH